MQLYDRDSEKKVLSLIVNSPAEIISQISDKDFTDYLHKAIYSVAKKLYENNVEITYAELAKEVSKTGETELDRLQMIMNDLVDVKNAKYWIDKVKNKTKIREFVKVMQEAREYIKKDIKADEIIAKVEESIYKLTLDDQVDEIITPQELAMYTTEQVDYNYNNRGKLDGLSTGIAKLDNVLWGLKPGDLMLLGAKTGHGKTAFALNLARRIAIVDKQPLLYLNTEMSKKQIATRFAAMLSGIDSHKIKSGYMSEEEFVKVQQSMDKLYNSELYFYNCPNLTIDKLISITRKFHTQKNIKAIILDYVGRMEKFSDNMKEWQMLEYITKQLKIIAQNLNLAAISLVQINEDDTLQAAKRMENECDIFIKIYPLENKQIEKLKEKRQFIEDPDYVIFVKKCRDGESNVLVPVKFNKSIQVVADVELF
jgi:replicative DNA helicase